MQYLALIMRLVLLFLLCYPSCIFATTEKIPDISPKLAIESIHIATGVWPGFTEPTEQGAYFELIKLLLPVETRLEVTYTGFNRTVKMVEEQQADMVLGVGLNESEQLHLSAKPFDIDQIAVLFKAGRLKFEKPIDLAGYQLVTQRGYNYEMVLGITTQSYEVDSITTGVNLVRTGRVDAFLVEKTELEGKLSARQLDDMQVVFLAGEPIYIGFAKNERGTALKAWWDQQFQQHYQSGQLQTLYQRHAGMTLP